MKINVDWLSCCTEKASIKEKRLWNICKKIFDSKATGGEIIADIYGDTKKIIEDCLYAMEPFIESVLPKIQEDKYFDHSDLDEIEGIFGEYLNAAWEKRFKFLLNGEKNLIIYEIVQMRNRTFVLFFVLLYILLKLFLL